MKEKSFLFLIWGYFWNSISRWIGQTTFQMLYFVGLGLGNEEDITLRGLKAVKSCEKIFLENYTSVLGVGKENLVW